MVTGTGTRWGVFPTYHIQNTFRTIQMAPTSVWSKLQFRNIPETPITSSRGPAMYFTHCRWQMRSIYYNLDPVVCRFILAVWYVNAIEKLFGWLRILCICAISTAPDDDEFYSDTGVFTTGKVPEATVDESDDSLVGCAELFPSMQTSIRSDKPVCSKQF